MAGPLRGMRVLCAGPGRVLDAGRDLLALLGAEVVTVAEVAGPVHAARLADTGSFGALDTSGALLAAAPPFPVVQLAADPQPDVAWAQAGGWALTGAPAPGLLVDRLLGAGAVVQLLAAARGAAVDLDPLQLLGERAACAGLGWQGGTTSVGGACHVLAAADGWIALNLPRPEDIEVLPALLDGEVEVGDWTGTVAAIAARPVAALVERAELLGLPLGGWPGPGGRDAGSPFRIDGREPGRTPHVGVGLAAAASTPALVVDLTSLWAGPLATSLLVARGTRVIKVEGARRPDGARRGPAAFFDLLNHGKESVALDFDRAEDVALLHRLVARADVVVEASRPRVMERLGLDPVAVVRTGTTTWISITGYGRTGAGANRVAFGDDAAFAAGCTVGDPPRLVADAVADPIAGLYGAAVALAALVGARGNVVDLALVDAAAYACGDAAQSRPADATVTVAPPTTRDPRSPAPAFGASTAVVRAEFGVASAR